MRTGGILVLGLASVLVTGCAADRGRGAPQTARVHHVKTADGWAIELVQYLPAGVPTGRPVLLCPGFSANARHVDLDEAHSLARWLAAHGREAWTVSIRSSRSPHDVPEHGRGGAYTFDTIWKMDIRAAIEFVRAHAQTPALIAEAERSGLKLAPEISAMGAEKNPRVDFVGHSMGGMLIYAYLSQGGEGINAVATLGAPTRLDWGGRMEPYMIQGSRFALAGDGAIPVSLVALLTVPVQGQFDDPIQRLLYNPQNVTTDTWRRVLTTGIEDMSSALWLQIVRVFDTGEFKSADLKTDYRRDMAKIRNPVFVVAGKVDRIAPPPSVRDGFRALGGPKEWFVAGEENGLQADYGHMDLVVGERAATEVWPRLLDFLDRHP